MSERRNAQPKNQCQVVSALIPPYALGGIDLAERELVERHLRVCTSCREEVQALEDVAGLLPLAVVDQERDPAPSTWMAIVDRIAADDDDLPMTMASAGFPGIETVDPPPAPERAAPGFARYVPAAIIAPLAIALLVVGAWANSLKNDLDDANPSNIIVAPEMLNDENVRTYAVERSCVNCNGSGQLGLSDSSQLGMMVAWDFDPTQQHQVWGVTSSGETTKVCELYVDPAGTVMQTFMLPDETATLSEIYITDEDGNLIYVARLEPVTPTPTVPSLSISQERLRPQNRA